MSSFLKVRNISRGEFVILQMVVSVPMLSQTRKHILLMETYPMMVLLANKWIKEHTHFVSMTLKGLMKKANYLITA